MASIISVDTLQDSAGSNEITTANVKTAFDGSAKVWVNADGTGTIAIRDSLNVSSITDTSTGRITVNFSNNFSNTNYAQYGISNNWHTYAVNGDKAVGSNSVASGNSSHTNDDSAQMNYKALGDLA